MAAIVVNFYDEHRAHRRRRLQFLRPRHVRLAVPKRGCSTFTQRAREAIMYIGLLGAMGEISFDDIKLERCKEVGFVA